MRRTTVVLPPELKRRAQLVAARKGVSFGALMRSAIARYTEEEPVQERDPLFAVAPLFRDGGERDLAQRLDDELYGKP